MSKLYPPEIGGTIPAFYDNGTDNYIKLSVPFIMNKTVSEVDVSGFALIIRTVANSKLIATLRVDTPTDWNFKKNEVYFKIYKDDNLFDNLYIGSHYKIQLAYVGSDNVIGYYSAVGVVKYTTKPIVAIDGLETTGPNMNLTTYVGTYSQDGLDMTEKVYSYIFNIYDKSNNLYITSGEQLHNSFEDINRYSSRDTFTLTKDLIDNQAYYIEYIVKTINNAEFSSGRYKIVNKTTVNPKIEATLAATLNYDNGYIDVRLVGKLDADGVEHTATGQFVLKRGSSKDNYTEWNTILTFRLNGSKPSRWLYRDFTIEHGYNYKYALQQFNDYNMYSNKIYSNEVYGAFEDMFLYDGEKQLKMHFNPKVTSFKNTILETRTNTIGNKYPFTFRNKSVYYKEFPINGLLSYYMDEEELFVSNKEILLTNQTTDLIDSNLASERLFKLKVLEFFNDGKPKLFRSPTEGNYLVKLTNVSMTPTDQLGRMLHSITGTAYEIADFTYESLTNLNFITLDDFQDDMIIRWETINLKDYSMNSNILAYAPAYDLLFENVVPGTIIQITYDDGSQSSISIGVTGQYKLNSKQPINSIQIVSGGATAGSLMYSYKTNTINTFDAIKGVELNDYPMIQLYGTVDLLNYVQDARTELLDIHYVRFMKRHVQDIYYKKVKIDNEYIDMYFKNATCTVEFSENEYNPQYIYRVLEPTTGENNMFMPTIIYYFEGSIDKKLTKEEYSNTIMIDGIQIDITETEFYELKHPEGIKSIITSPGVITECGYNVKIYDYNINADSFDILIPKGRMHGDIDGDGYITSSDSSLVSQYLSGSTELTDIQKQCADINRDGIITGNNETGDETKDYEFDNQIILNISAQLEEPAYGGDEVLGNWKANTNYKNKENNHKQFYYDIPVKDITTSHSVKIKVNNPNYTEDKFLCECLNGKLRIWVRNCPITDLEATITYDPTVQELYEEAYKNYTDLLFYRNDESKYVDGNGYFTDEYFTDLNNAYKVLYPDNGTPLYDVYLSALEKALLQEEVNSGNVDIE